MLHVQAESTHPGHLSWRDRKVGEVNGSFRIIQDIPALARKTQTATEGRQPQCWKEHGYQDRNSPSPRPASFLINAKNHSWVSRGKNLMITWVLATSLWAKSHETRTGLYQDQRQGLCGPGLPWTSLEIGRSIAVRPWARLQLEIWVWALHMVLFLETLDLSVVPGDGQSPRAVCRTEEYIEKTITSLRYEVIYLRYTES